MFMKMLVEKTKEKGNTSISICLITEKYHEFLYANLNPYSFESNKQ